MFWKFAKGGVRVPEQLSIPRMPTTRPCLVSGKPARFHRWIEEDKGLLRIDAFVREEEQSRLIRAFREDGVVPNCCNVEMLRVTVALVEYPDGTVCKVQPEAVRFLDREEG